MIGWGASAISDVEETISAICKVDEKKSILFDGEPVVGVSSLFRQFRRSSGSRRSGNPEERNCGSRRDFPNRASSLLPPHNHGKWAKYANWPLPEENEGTGPHCS
jgi:hypothetical protein